MTDPIQPATPSPSPAENPRPGLASFAAVGAWAAGLQAAVWGVLWLAFGRLSLGYRFFDLSDITLPYQPYAASLWRGLAAYRDFPIEYPPLFVPLLYAGGDPTNDGFAARFALAMMAFMVAAGVVTAIAGTTAQHPRRGYVVGALYAGFVLVLGPIAANRYDPVVALVLAVALLLMFRGSWRWAAAVLGIGFALKITPALLLPLLLVLTPGNRVWSTMGAFTAAALAPFAWVLSLGGQAHGAVFGVFAYHLARPLEIESVLAMPLWVGRLLGGAPLVVSNVFGSQGLETGAAGLLGKLSGPLLIATFVLVMWLVVRRRAAIRTDERLIALAALAIILGSLVTSKVLSPQYFVWILPLAALVAPERKVLGALMGVAFLLTQVLFPANYWAFAQTQSPLAIAIVLARNAVLVAAFALSVWELWRIPAKPSPTEAPVEAVAQPA